MSIVEGLINEGWDSWMIVAGIIYITCLFGILLALLGRWQSRRAHQRARKNFWEAVERGERPEYAPKYFGPEGGFSVNSADLLASASGQRQLEALDKIMALAKKKRIPMFERFYEGEDETGKK